VRSGTLSSAADRSANTGSPVYEQADFAASPAHARRHDLPQHVAEYDEGVQRAAVANFSAFHGRSPDKLGIEDVRAYWKRTRPPHWLFPGPDPSKPVTTRSLQRALRSAADAAGLDDEVTVHTLRHSFATHLLEQGVDIRVIQDLLGHRQITSTTRYARVALDIIRQIQSPLESLNLEGMTPA